MAWIAVYAGWSSVLGLVVAAITGETLDDGDRVAPTVGLGVSTLFTILLPLVPTLVALWFNDWLRDGAPSKADRDRARGGGAAGGPPAVDRPRVARTELPEAVSAPIAAPSSIAAPPPRDVVDPGVRRGQPSVRVVPPGPLGVPEVAAEATSRGGFPVARLLRATDTAPQSPVASPAPAAGGAAAPLIDPADPLGVGDLDLTGGERG